MKWFVGYEKPPLRGIYPIDYENAEQALCDMAMMINAGHIVRSIHRDDWYPEDDHKTPDQNQQTMGFPGSPQGDDSWK